MLSKTTVSVFRSGGVNGAIAVLALALSFIGGARSSATPSPVARDSASSAGSEPRPTGPHQNAQGQSVLLDAGGWPMPMRQYSRIASASALADPILLRLCSPDRIVAYSEHSLTSRDNHRFSRKSQAISSRRIEAILQLAPDLLVINSLGQAAQIRQLREAGIAVFDLGAMRGLSTFLENVEQLGWLVGHPERGQRYALQFGQRMENIYKFGLHSARPSAIYVGFHAGRLYGGTTGTSYHDVLHNAGLNDIAKLDFQGWPAFTAENLLMLNPQFIVTQTNMGAQICADNSLSRLRACGEVGAIVELEPQLIGDPGVGMLAATESLHRQVYGSLNRKALQP